MDDHIKHSNNNNNNNTLFHPIIYKKEKFITIVQTMIGALAGSQLKEKMFKCLGQGHKNKENRETHTNS